MEAAKPCLPQRIVLTRPNLTAYKDEHSPWNFSLTCLFSYMLPFSKNQSRGEKKKPKTTERSKANVLWRQLPKLAWDQMDTGKSGGLPGRSPRMPALLHLPDGNQVCRRVGANSAQHHSFISDGNRFYTARITCWFSPQHRLTPQERQDTGSILITPPGAKQLPGH